MAKPKYKTKNPDAVYHIAVVKFSKKVLKRNQQLNNIKLQKPFLKWVGGKTQIINTIIKHIPEYMNNYHEIFLGGGSVLFAILTLQKNKQINIKNDIYAYDINQTLINVYKHVQNNPDKLLKYLTKYINEYDSLTGDEINRNPNNKNEAITSKESYYYWVRKIFNNDSELKTKIKNDIERSSIFMFLNKTCFRGMYREGPNGFNVPYGHYKTTPAIITKEELYNVSQLIKNVKFECRDFSQSISNVKKGDFVYLDPPYAPENSKSFVSYTNDGFDLATHKKLFDQIITIDTKQAKFMLSNAKVELVTDYFEDFNCTNITARRAINSKKPGTTTMEVIIGN